MKNLKTRDIMSENVLWVKEDQTVPEVVDIFVEEMISGAPVVDDEGILKGVVSMRDCVRNGYTTPRFEAGGKQTVYYEQGWELPLSEEEVSFFRLEGERDLTVKEIMTPMLFSVDPETPIDELADMMLKGRIHRVLVLENDELVGIVTTMDMLKIIREMSMPVV